MKKYLALFLTVILTVTLLAACSGSGGIAKGTYVPTSEDEASAPYSSLSFNGSKVTIGMIGGIMSYDDIPYTFEGGTLSFDLGGMNVDLPCKLNDDGSFELATATYIKK